MSLFFVIVLPECHADVFCDSVSKEKSIQDHHMIIPNGYDIGRDMLIKDATERETSFLGVRYRTEVLMLPMLLPIGATDVNHGELWHFRPPANAKAERLDRYRDRRERRSFHCQDFVVSNCRV